MQLFNHKRTPVAQCLSCRCHRLDRPNFQLHSRRCPSGQPVVHMVRALSARTTSTAAIRTRASRSIHSCRQPWRQTRIGCSICQRNWAQHANPYRQRRKNLFLTWGHLGACNFDYRQQRRSYCNTRWRNQFDGFGNTRRNVKLIRGPTAFAVFAI